MAFLIPLKFARCLFSGLDRFLFAPQRWLDKMLPFFNFGQDAGLFALLFKAAQGRFKTFPFFERNSRHKLKSPSLSGGCTMDFRAKVNRKSTQWPLLSRMALRLPHLHGGGKPRLQPRPLPLRPDMSRRSLRVTLNKPQFHQTLLPGKTGNRSDLFFHWITRKAEPLCRREILIKMFDDSGIPFIHSF